MLVSGGYHRLKPDYQIIPHTRFQRAEDYFKIVSQKHGEDIHLTGHSLGGSVATHIASKYGKKGVVFNAGETPQDLNSPYFNSEQKQIRSYIVPGDVISMSGALFRNHDLRYVPKKMGSSKHSMINFLPDKGASKPRSGIQETRSKPTGVEPSGSHEILNTVEVNGLECRPPYYKKCDKKGSECKCTKPKPKIKF